tara:strand:- start:8270 stop:8479 length:210 start_codon:yes stop_codon:yes gene_type:complete
MDSITTMLAFTFVLLLVVVFFITISITVINVRRENREDSTRLSDKIDKLEGLFLSECKTLVKEFKNLKK